MPQTLRDRVPRRWRRRLVGLKHSVRKPTASLRVLPDFMIIGTQRGGTSSLYRYLAHHPDTIASIRKETEYFSGRYAEGTSWYRAHFPMAIVKGLRPRMVTFEATPDYLLHPLAASRAHHLVPQARLIVLLREPVARAFSHFRHMQRLGFETLDFASALAAENSRIQPDLQRLATDPDYRPVRLLRYSYKTRGLYSEQLERWLAFYPKNRMLVISSESFYGSTREEFGRVLEFLGLREWQPPQFENVSRPASEINKSSMDPEIAADLSSYFREPNEALFSLLGADLGWT